MINDSSGRLMICRRPAHKRHGGLWEFPGGKIEAGESVLAAAARELLEELGVTVVSAGEMVFSVQDPGSVFHIEFYPIRIVGVPAPVEHSEIRWVRPEELLALPLAPSDEQFARTVAGS